MLADGEIDALITAVRPLCFTENGAERRAIVSRLSPVEEAYYRKTGMFPIMHMMGVAGRWPRRIRGFPAASSRHACRRGTSRGKK
jgi:hypothetical protein